MAARILPFAAERRLQLANLPPELDALLRPLLRYWGYLPESSAGAPLVLEGETGGEAGGLRLNAHGDSAPLPLPLSPETLWLHLERLFHDPPREHLRLNLSLRGTLRHTTFAEPFYTLTLSDAGMRLRFPRELVRGEQLTADLQLPQGIVTLPTEVIYAFPSRTGYSLTVGLIFAAGAVQERTLVREHLLVTSLGRARSELPAATFQRALDWLELPPRVRTALLAPA